MIHGRQAACGGVREIRRSQAVGPVEPDILSDVSNASCSSSLAYRSHIHVNERLLVNIQHILISFDTVASRIGSSVSGEPRLQHPINRSKRMHSNVLSARICSVPTCRSTYRQLILLEVRTAPPLSFASRWNGRCSRWRRHVGIGRRIDSDDRKCCHCGITNDPC